LKRNGKNCENSRKNVVYMENFEIKNLKKKKLFLMNKKLPKNILGKTYILIYINI
jgi:hypothetical protein